MHTLLLAAVYLWIGFTAGYFFRKWLERSLVPRFQAETQNTAAAGGPATGTSGATADAGGPVVGAAGAAAGSGGLSAEAAGGPSAEERVDWVDDQDRVLEVLPRREIRRRNLLHRVTATFVFHPDGRLFLQQRTMTKDVYPGLFDPCVGGTVASGETYAENAAREVAEELGVTGAPLYFLFAHRFQDASTNSLIQVFACIHDGPIRLQEAEVAGGDWTGEARVEALIAEGRVCPDSAMGWRMYLERFGAKKSFARDVAPGLKTVGRAGDPASS